MVYRCEAVYICRTVIPHLSRFVPRITSFRGEMHGGQISSNKSSHLVIIIIT